MIYKIGKYSGAVYRKLNLIQKKTSLKIKYYFEAKFPLCLKGMKSGNYDIMAYTKKKPDRDKYMTHFRTYGKETGLYVSKKSPFHNYPKELEKLFSHVYPAK